MEKLQSKLSVDLFLKSIKELTAEELKNFPVFIRQNGLDNKDNQLQIILEMLIEKYSELDDHHIYNGELSKNVFKRECSKDEINNLFSELNKLSIEYKLFLMIK